MSDLSFSCTILSSSDLLSLVLAWLAPRDLVEVPARETGRISIGFHSISLVFGRAIFSRGEIKAWVLFSQESLREHPR